MKRLARILAAMALGLLPRIVLRYKDSVEEFTLDGTHGRLTLWKPTVLGRVIVWFDRVTK